MNDKYWIAFSAIESIDSLFIKRLYNYFGDIQKAYCADLHELKNIEGLSVKKAERFVALRDKQNIDSLYDGVIERDIQIITYENDKYPYMLRQIENPPAVLYVRGDLDSCNLEKTIAVVGSRRCSSNGKESLKRIISGLANTDLCIVSGLASGIDTTAHECAIESNLKTIGVIASGFDYIYPTSNKQLYEKIKDSFGAIITEYYPTFEPLKFRFPQRNRIVSGISYGTLVVEAALKSGALITANLTLDQGRELMCIPGLIFNPNTEGIYRLLKNGATLVTESNDILSALNWTLDNNQNNKQMTLFQTQDENLNEDEKTILKILEIEAKGFDAIQFETKFEVDRLLNSLTMLELKGIIKQQEGDRYIKV